MNIINTKSLAETIDNLNETFFYKQTLTKTQKEQAAKWISGRQGMPGAYWNMFAPTETDYRNGIRLFTGEWITSGAATGHILGEEASRALLLLNLQDKSVKNSLNNAIDGLFNALKRAYDKNPAVYKSMGYYCCGKCSVAFWRNINAGGLDHHEKRLSDGMKYLKSMRDSDGKWKRFPFFYTLLALIDIDIPAAKEELRYASGVCEKLIKRTPARDKYSLRKREIAQRVLEKC